MAKSNGANTFWVARTWGEYHVLHKEPAKWYADWHEWDSNKVTYELHRGGPLEGMCHEEFEKFTGIKLQDGQFVQVKMSAVGDVWETTAEPPKKVKDGLY